MYFEYTDSRPQLVVEPMNLSVVIINGNETGTLQCNAFAGLTYTWDRENSTVPNKAIRREEGTILEFPNIRREDAGSYRCVVRNDIGESTSQYVQITVTGKTMKRSTEPTISTAMNISVK